MAAARSSPPTASRPAQRDSSLVPGHHAGKARADPHHGTKEAAIATRTALVGGGATGIGLATARTARARRAPGRHHGPHAGTARGSGRPAASSGPAPRSTCWCTTSPIPDAAEAAVRVVESRHGSLDVLVLNAGGPPPGRILDVDDEQWQDGVRAAAARPAAAGPARRCRAWPSAGSAGSSFVTSTAVRQPQPDLATSVVLRSAVTRGGQAAVPRVRRGGVTVNCVAPGATATDRRARGPAPAGPARPARAIADLDAPRTRATIPAGRAGAAGGDRRPRWRSWPPPRRATSTGPCSRSTADRTETI